MNRSYSVLMSVYKNDSSLFLEEAIESIAKQTVLTDDFVIVKDGPLTKELDLKLLQLSEKYEFIKIYGLEKNEGLGNALNFGLKKSKNDIIMRMDSDDISLPSRAEEQLRVFKTNDFLDVVGSNIEEFTNNEDEISGIRLVPETQNEIKVRMKHRNPLNHPSVMYKKKSVESVNGYIELKYHEDYFLWVRMMNENFCFYNIQKPLLKMRTSDDTYTRRRGWHYFKTQVTLFEYMYHSNLINLSELFFNSTMSLITKVLMPKSVLKLIYLKILR